MKDRIVFVICFFFAVFLLHPAITLAAARPQVITIVMDNNYPPYVFLNSEGKLQGILVDQWKLWEQKTGIKADISAMDWGEALRRMKAGEFDVIDTIFKTEERARWLDFSGAYSSEELGKIESTWNGSPLVNRKQLRYFFSIAGGLCLLVLVLFTWNRTLKRKVEKLTGDLKTREERVSLILNSMAEGIYGVDLQGICTFCNPAALRFLGYERAEEIVGRKIHPLIHHTKSDGAYYHSKDCKIYSSCREGRGAHSDDEVFWRSDGTSFPVEYWAQPIMHDGTLTGAVTAFADIRERKRAEEDRLAHLRFFESLDQVNRVIQGANGLDEMMSDVLDTALTIFGCDRAWLVYPCDPEAPSWRVPMERTRAEYPGAFARGMDLPMMPDVRQALLEVLHSNGPVVYDPQSGRSVQQVSRQFSVLSQILTAVYPKMGKPWVFGLHQCSHARVWSEKDVRLFTEIARRIGDGLSSLLFLKDMRESEQRFREILENMSLIGLILDTEGRIILCNDYLLSLTGWKREDVLHKNWFDVFLPPDVRADIEASVFLPFTRTGQIQAHYENAIITRQGEQRLISWSNIALRDESGIVTGVASIGEDITERKRMEEALQRSENLLQTIIDMEPDCVKMVDAQGNLIMMNRAGLDMIEVDDFEQVKGQCVCPFITSEHRQAFMDLTTQVFEGKSGNLMFEMVGRKGRHVWLETRAVPFRNEKNEIIALLGITRDITERRKLEDQLRQSQKMESVGTLAGGVAHDFNNILTAISGYGHLALMKMTPGDPNRMNIQQILESADRAAHLTRDLLLFSRKQPIDRKPVDLNEGIQRLSKFLARVIGEDIAFKTTLSGGAIPVLADAYQIDQVLMNLATNARDAMPKGGAFTITTEQVWLNESFTFSRGLGMSGKYAVISVSDTGQGMDEETRQRVFEPFFTTKEVGKGTGLGLSVVYGIVQQHDGQVTVYSEPGHGTTFRIYLPINETNISAEPAAVAEEPPVGGTETILLAEDDKTVREMTLLMLEDFGYAVVTAVDGEDAVKQFGENKDRVELLLFDLIMPGKSGKDAYDEIRLIRPDIKVIFASGYDPDMVRQKALLEQHVPVVYKPVPMATLLKTIRAVLDG